MKREKPLTVDERLALGEILIPLIEAGHVKSTVSGPLTEYTGIASDGTEVSLGNTFTYGPKGSKLDGRGLLNYLRARPKPEQW